MKVKESIIKFLLCHLKKRPGMFLGSNYISLLSTFMTGYIISLNNNGYDLTTDPYFGKEGEGFFAWYSKKRGLTQSSNWYLTMLEQADNDEEKGLELFFSSLEDFCKEKGVNL